MNTPSFTYGANVRVNWIKETEESEQEWLIDGHVSLGRGNYLSFNEDLPDLGDTEVISVFLKTKEGYISLDENELDAYELDSISELMYNTYVESLEDQTYLDYERELNDPEVDNENEFY